MNVHYLSSVSDAEKFIMETDEQLKKSQPYSPEKQHLMWLLRQVSIKGKVDHAIKRKATALIYKHSDDREAINEFVYSHKCKNPNCCEEYEKSAAFIRNYWNQQDKIKGVI